MLDRCSHHRHEGYFIAFVYLAFTVSNVPRAFPQSTAYEGIYSSEKTDCVEHKQFVQLTTVDLLKRAIEKKEPDFPLLDQAQFHARVVVRIFVNENGRVVCAKIAGKVHPLLVSGSIEAARSWRFQPLIREGQSRGMQGNLLFQIDR